MNIKLTLSVFLSCFYANTLAQSPLSNLEQLQWQNRIILINHKTECATYTQRLIEKEYDINDRDIVWLIICNARNKPFISNYQGEITSKLLTQINKQYFSNNHNKVILIGKDGGIKYQSDDLNLKEINLEIDSMPMRIEEMRSKKKRHNNDAFK